MADENDGGRRVRPRPGETLELLIASREFLEEILEDLQFMPMETRRRKTSLTFRGSSQVRGLELVDDGGCLSQLFAELRTFPSFETISIEQFAFKVPAQALATLLQDTQNSLTSLSLSNVQISLRNDDGNDVEALCEVLGQIANLESLTIKNVRLLSQNGTSEEEINSVLSLLRACRGHALTLELDVFQALEKDLPSLRFLMTQQSQEEGANWRISRAGARNRLNALQVQKSSDFLSRLLEDPDDMIRWEVLQFPMLGFCEKETMVPIAKALKSNNYLKKLCLGIPSGLRNYGMIQNGLSEQAVLSLQEMAKENSSLQEIVFLLERTTRVLNVPMDPVVSFYLRLNRVGRRRLLGAAGVAADEATREEWLNAIIPNRADVSVTHFFLTKNPSLLLPTS